MCFVLGPAAKPIRQRIRHTIVTLDVHANLNSQVHVDGSQG